MTITAPETAADPVPIDGPPPSDPPKKAPAAAPEPPPLRSTLQATVDVGQLRDAVAWAAFAAPAKPPLAVLAGVLLEGGSDGLKVSAFDYEVSATETIVAPGSRGRVLVHARQLMAMLRGLPRASTVELAPDIPGEGEALVLTGGNEGGEVRYRLPAMEVESYPSIPSLERTLLTLTRDELRKLTRPLVAAGKDDTLPVLTGVHIEVEDGRFTAAATDRYRLAVSTFAPALVAQDLVLHVPATALGQVQTGMGKADQVTLTYDLENGYGGPRAAWFGASAGARSLVTRTLDGDFPKYRSLLPAEDNIRTFLDVERDDFLDAALAVRPVLMRNAPAVLTVTPARTFLASSLREDTSPQASARVRGATVTQPADAQPEHTLGVNIDYFESGLRTFPPGPVELAITASQRPIRLASRDDNSWLYLLMPVRLENTK